MPTYHIVRFLLYAFMIAMIYPYLPGANSGVFQGVSVFVGLIVSLGSSTVIGNIIAGFVITYMRAFKQGDRIKLNDTVGNVIEKDSVRHPPPHDKERDCNDTELIHHVFTDGQLQFVGQKLRAYHPFRSDDRL